MRIITSILLSIGVLLLLSGCQNGRLTDTNTNSQTTAGDMAERGEADKEDAAFIDVCGKEKLADSIEELEDYSNAIVIATVQESKTHPNLGKDDRITLTTIQIDQVIYSDSGLKEEARVMVIEYYRTETDAENNMRIISTNGTLPLVKDEQYLLFLRNAPIEQDYGDYAITYGWQGKYPISDNIKSKSIKDITTEDLEWTQNNAYAIGKEIAGVISIPLAEQVLDKYFCD